MVTDQADKEGVKCYLESSKMVPNVEIYRKMGFEVMRAMDCVDGEDSCKVSGVYTLHLTRSYPC